VNIRFYTTVLSGAAINPEKLRHGNLQLSHFSGITRACVIIEIHQVLYRTLAKSGFTNDKATAIILYRSCENLRSRSAVTIDQNRKRTIPGHTRIGVLLGADTAAGIAYLYNRAFIDEQAGQRGCLEQRPATVVSQVNDQSLDTFSLHFIDQLPDIARTGAVIR